MGSESAGNVVNLKKLVADKEARQVRRAAHVHLADNHGAIAVQSKANPVRPARHINHARGC
jgi:hypothetical protein